MKIKSIEISKVEWNNNQ